VGRRRVLDSTPIYDAVATMDTVTLVRSAIRGLLLVCEPELEAELRGVLRRDDDYRSAGKPVCDYDDPQAREALVDALAKDARALVLALDGRELEATVSEAAELLASVTGQDLEEGEDGIFRIARRVAKDRIISTVDPDARHGHKTSARGFDGYKGHVSLDPDSELILATAVTAANGGDAAAADELLAHDLPATDEPPHSEQPKTEQPEETETEQPEPKRDDDEQSLSVYGDSAYGSGELVNTLEQAGAEASCKVQPPVAPGGRFSKDAFTIDLEGGTVSCPAGNTTSLRPFGDGQIAKFAAACAGCPLADRCTSAKEGRTIYVGPYEQQLARARQRQSDPAWKADYKATRPKVERKISHLMRRRHGGRRARVRGKPKVSADFALLAAAVNLARLAVLGTLGQHGAWQAHGA
jgi:Transposase DDE domain